MSKKTLVLEVVALASSLFLIAFIAVSTARVHAADARDEIRVKQMSVLFTAINQYHKDFGYYPAIPGGELALSKGSVACSDGTHGTESWCGLIAALQPYLHEPIVDPRSEEIYSYYYNADGEHPHYFGLMVMLESVQNTALADGDGGQFCTTCGAGKRYRGYELGTLPSYCATQSPDRSWTAGKDGELCGSQ